MMERLAGGFHFLEGPVWDPARGLLFTDAVAGGVYCLRGDGGVELVVAHRRGIGGIALHEAGGLIVSGRNIAYKPGHDGGTVVILEGSPADGIVGFNDIATDGAGRLYVGALGFRPTVSPDLPRPGLLQVIDLGGPVRTLASGIQLANGIGFSPDGGTLYMADSGARDVLAFDVQPDGGVSGRRRFAHVEGGLPDGLAVSADGAVWVAVAHGGAVDVFAPDGRRRERIACPVLMVTSLCFGGDDLHDLYVVTGTEGAEAKDGAIFRRRLDVPGVRVGPARISLAPRPGAVAAGSDG